jgi:hypothetical protein
MIKRYAGVGGGHCGQYLRPVLAHRFALERDSMDVVHQVVGALTGEVGSPITER